MTERKILTREAMRAAMDVRQELQIQPTAPICSFDAADKLGVTVRFTDEAPSMEGMYVGGDQPNILVCSLRPIGRQAMTCAHELGHDRFGHGTRIDEYLDQGSHRPWQDPDEWLADRFANFLLMPKAAVLRAFRDRELNLDAPSPVSIWTIACQLGVGYEALINHLTLSLDCLDRQIAETLLRVSPKDIRRSLVGSAPAENHLVLVDYQWPVAHPIDLQVGDQALLPGGYTLEGACAEHRQTIGVQELICAVRPGIGRVSSPDGSWACFLRVCRRQYIGLARYRHLEDPDHD